MSKDNYTPSFIRYTLSKNNAYTEEIVPLKVEEANSHKNPIIHNQSEEQIQQNLSQSQTKLPSPTPKPIYYNPYYIVNELEELNKIKIKGIIRVVLEYIANCNLKGQCPTQKDIFNHIKNISDDNLKKILYRARNNGLLCLHPEKIGNEYQYVLANMQDSIKVKEKNPEVKDEEFVLENNVEKFFLQVLRNKPNPEVHHITLKSNLENKDDYNFLNWDISSINNKAKLFEKKLSRYRIAKIIVYPNGTVNMIIAASKQPFDWLSREGWISFIEICGEILSEIKNALIHPEPLQSKIYNWQVTQFDIGYDIPLSKIDNQNKSSKKGTLELIRLFNGCIKVKHLDRIYQIYNKQLPTKGICMRIEEQCSFSSTSSPSSKKDNSNKNVMTISEFKKSFHPTVLKDIINIVIPIDQV